MRKIIADCGLKLNQTFEEFDGNTLGETLLTPTKIYVRPVLDAIRKFDIHGICHITGGGFDENIPRILKAGQGFSIDEGTWEILPVFKKLEEWGHVPHREMYNIFNMGIGMIIVADKKDAEGIINTIAGYGEKAQEIGKVTEGANRINIINAN